MSAPPISLHSAQSTQPGRIQSIVPALTLASRLPQPVGFRSLLAHLVSLYQRAGQLVRTLSAPYHLSDCGGAAPCTCAWPTGLSSTYTVSGFGGLSACAGCDSDTTDPPWDGSVHHVGAGCIWWAADASFDPLSINGVMLDITYTQVLLRTTSPCRWELYIACGSAINPTKTMWAGYKTGGSTPAGIYSFVSSDCGNTTGTMTVV